MHKREVVSITQDLRGIEVILESLWLADIIVSRDAIYFGQGTKPRIIRPNRKFRALRFQ